MHRLLVFILSTILFASCSESQKTVNLALKKDGKAYLYSIMDEGIVHKKIAHGEMPALMNSTALVPEDGQLFMDASKIKTICNVLGGNIEVIAQQEKSFDGYFVEGNAAVFTQQTKNKDSGEIGKIATEIEVTLINKDSKTYTISWQVSPELKAVQNCEIQSLTVKYSQNSEGEFTSKDFVVVNLEDINQFFGNGYTLRYDEAAGLLYVEER